MMGPIPNRVWVTLGRLNPPPTVYKVFHSLIHLGGLNRSNRFKLEKKTIYQQGISKTAYQKAVKYLEQIGFIRVLRRPGRGLYVEIDLNWGDEPSNPSELEEVFNGLD